MNPEANFYSADISHRSVSVTFEGSQQGVLAVAKKNGEAHYTEENPTIPETPGLQARIASHNMIRAAVDPANPGQAGDSSHVPVS